MMKKNMIAAGTAAGAAIMIGALTLTGVFPAFAADITADKAKEIAMSHAGVEEKDVAHIRAKKDYENGQQVYEVEFYTSDYKEYDYEIAAADGAIIAYDYDAEYWQNDVSQEGEAVDLEGAKAAALADAGLKAEDVTFFKTESDWDDGRQIYEIEFYTSDGTEYDYEINAAGGQVISCDFDAEHNGKRTQAGRQKASQGSSAGETSASADEITQDEAKAIALEQAGLEESKVSRIRIHRDRDDGRTVYEGSFVSGETEYEFEISASDGRILEWDRESIYD